MIFQHTIVPLLVPSIIECISRVLITRAFLDGDVTIDALTNCFRVIQFLTYNPHGLVHEVTMNRTTRSLRLRPLE
jgi:hypothetical protein